MGAVLTASDPWRRWFGNSAVNLVGGVAAAGVNVLLPAVVVKHLPAEPFALWNLALQMLVYVNLLSLGLQTATARAIAHAAEQVEARERMLVVARAAYSIARCSSATALGAVGVLLVCYPLLFPGVSPAMLGDFRITLALFGCSAVFQILAQFYMGVFQGLHRNIVFVGAQTTVRVITVLLVWAGAAAGLRMIELAGLMAFGTSLIFPGMVGMFRRFIPWAAQYRTRRVDHATRRELLKYCCSLSVWSVSMLAVNSVGIVIVGRVEFPMAGPYAIAMTAASAMVGLLSAALSPLITTAAAMHAEISGRRRLPSLLTRATFWTAILLNVAFVVLLLSYPTILRLWVGERFVSTVGPLLIVLIGAHCLRNIAAPYALMLVATGLHQRALFSAVLEAVANVIASLILGYRMGALGVAFGTAFGAVIGVLGTLVLNAGRTPELTPRPLYFSCCGFVIPLLSFAPVYWFAFANGWVHGFASHLI